MLLSDKLKAKWFLNCKRTENGFPPATRYPGSMISNYTDGNNVTPLIDGQDYMKLWHGTVLEMMGNSDAEIYHAAWRLDAVRTLGHTKPKSDALKLLLKAKRSGIKLHILTSLVNYKNTTKMFFRGIKNVCVDLRFTPGGGNHQKYICFKNPPAYKVMLGSLDVSNTRWDTSRHSSNDIDRHPIHGKPSHDVGVLIEGPAVKDIEKSFRDRWNDSTRSNGILPTPKHKITSPISNPAPVGTHSIQVLHTYGRTSEEFGYSWSPAGEFTIWASYLNAIKMSQKYIYIEDQYFLPFAWPPCFTRNGPARDSDIIYQLGEAIKRGVKVIILVPNTPEDATHIYLTYQRGLGIQYLSNIASSATGEFLVTSIHNGTSPIYVHSKLMICDDEFVLLGSANIGQRSMTYDSELQIGIIDAENRFPKALRKLLWTEHLQNQCPDDQEKACNAFKAEVLSNSRRLRFDPTCYPDREPIQHGNIYNTIIDLYGGPPR